MQGTWMANPARNPKNLSNPSLPDKSHSTNLADCPLNLFAFL
jgi:hypothetical protein